MFSSSGHCIERDCSTIPLSLVKIVCLILPALVLHVIELATEVSVVLAADIAWRLSGCLQCLFVVLLVIFQALDIDVVLVAVYLAITLMSV